MLYLRLIALLHLGIKFFSKSYCRKKYMVGVGNRFYDFNLFDNFNDYKMFLYQHEMQSWYMFSVDIKIQIGNKNMIS